MWTDFFDRIFLINLPDRKAKLQDASKELHRYNIAFEVYPAIKQDNGAYGLFQTMQELFSLLVLNRKRVLVFEDDIKIVRDPAPIMEKAIISLQKRKWDMFYLGPNTHQDFGLLEDGLLRLFNAFSTHAVAYSSTGIENVCRFKWSGKPIDVMITEQVQSLGNCYCSYPLIATQRNGYSDIDKKEVVYNYIEERFLRHTKHLR